MAEYKYVLSIILAFVGTVAGLAWAFLGVSALKYLPDSDEHDRVYGWTLWWFVREERYAAHGKRLCRYGWLSFGVGLAAWLGWFAMR
jgi:hypothetical protein